MKLIIDNREVIVSEIEHNKEICDSYIVAAIYIDTGEELNEMELLQLTEENLDILYEEWLDTQYAFGMHG